jgi:hypothetical protein
MIQFNNERELRDWLLNEVRNEISGERLSFQVLESKNVNDIVICKESEPPALALIEVKLYKGSSGRIGIGQGKEGKKGKGFQPEILTKRPVYFDRYLRWVICNENGKCVFANNKVVIKHAAGGKVAQGKQNNISTNIFNKEKTIDISKIADELIAWLKTM